MINKSLNIFDNNITTLNLEMKKEIFLQSKASLVAIFIVDFDVTLWYFCINCSKNYGIVNTLTIN
jgi:hypothetical protein